MANNSNSNNTNKMRQFLQKGKNKKNGQSFVPVTAVKKDKKFNTNRKVGK